MIAEWKAFDGAELAVGFDPADAQPRWRVVAPQDDGVLAALITSLRLSGGDDAPSVGDPPVMVRRLGGPGSAVGARLPEGVAFAGRPPELAAAVARLRSKAGADLRVFETLPSDLDGSGFLLTIDPDKFGLPATVDLTLARIATAARAAGLKTTLGRLALEDDHLDLNLATNLDPERRLGPDDQPPALDPSWAACVPVDGVQAALTIAFGRGAGFWNRVFEVADRVDRADPARAELAPLRIRLNLLAAARGVRLEANLWPMLRGVTVAALTDPAQPGRTAGVLLALHAERPEAADRILSQVVAPLSGSGRGMVGEGAKPRALGELSGRPLEAASRGSTVFVGWGEGMLERGLRSIDEPDRSAAKVIAGAAEGGRAVNRAALYWPGRLTFPIAGFRPSSPLTASLSTGSPIIWTGGEEGGRAWDLVRWPDLRRLVARFLDQVPQAPPAAP